MGRMHSVSLVARVTRDILTRSYRNFNVSFADDFAVCSSAYRIGRGSESQMSHVDTYSPNLSTSLISWQLGILEKILAVS